MISAASPLDDKSAHSLSRRVEQRMMPAERSTRSTQTFAYLGVCGLPLRLPTTTGGLRPLPGGVLVKP